METAQFSMISDVQTPSSDSSMEQATIEEVIAVSEPVELQIFVPAGDESQDDPLEIARVLDAVEEARRSGEAADHGDEQEQEYTEYDAYGCQCLECLNYDDRYNDDYYGGGLDWNESGYFD
jgi:hypothetical protein